MKALLLAAIALLPAQAIAQADLPSPVVPDGLGVNIHFTDPKPGELEMLAGAGFRWVRMDFGWERTEPRKGEYDFAPYDRLMKALDAHKIRAVFILDYSNRLYEANRSVATEEGRQAYARWAAAAVKHFQGRGILWEIWNEPNIEGFWKPKPDSDQYTSMALAASKAIRQAAPGEWICGPATSTIDLKFLEACFRAGLLEQWDAVSVHPYRQNDPETVADEYQALRHLIARSAPKGKSVPILSGEWGYSAGWKGFDADRQGKMLARQFLTNLENGIPLSIWYDWHDDGNDPKEPEHHFGTVAHAYHAGREPVYDPKPAYRAAKALTTSLNGARFVRRLALGGPDVHALLFEKGPGPIVAAWTTGEPGTLEIPSNSRDVPVINHLGERSAAIGSKGGFLSIPIDDTPRYLEFPDADRRLAEVPAALRLRVDWIRSRIELIARIENVENTDFRGKANLQYFDGNDATTASEILQLAPDQPSTTLRFAIGPGDAAAYRAGLVIQDDRGRTVLSIPPRRITPLPDSLIVASKAVADGDPQVGSSQSIERADAPEPFPAADRAVMKVSYKFDPGWKFARIVPEEPATIEGQPTGFAIWIRGDGRGGSPRIRVVDSRGQTWQPSGESIDRVGWRRVVFPLRPSTAHWGGPNDGVIHYPLRWDSTFLFDNPSRRAAEGAVWIAAPEALD
ncbi:MAG: cellulase family glycosylhydrolase [Isosphaeraceae bacterium]